MRGTSVRPPIILTSCCSGYGDRGGYRGGRDGGRTWNEERGSYERGGYRDGRGGGFGGQGGRGGGGGWGGDRDNGYNNGRWQEDRGNRDGGFDNFNRGGGGGRYVFTLRKCVKQTMNLPETLPARGRYTTKGARYNMRR